MAPKNARPHNIVQTSRWSISRAKNPAVLQSTAAISTKMSPRRRAEFPPGMFSPAIRFEFDGRKLQRAGFRVKRQGRPRQKSPSEAFYRLIKPFAGSIAAG